MTEGPHGHWCSSERNIDGEQIHCERSYGHSIARRHQAVLEDGTLITWDGGYSADLLPRITDG